MVDRVIFKKEPDGDFDGIVAFFPRMTGDMSPETMGCYAHLGQHGAACMNYAAGLENATPEEYAELKRELEHLGYELEIVEEFTQADFDARELELKAMSA